MRAAICSDINLELSFKQMTWKKKESFREKQLENFDNLITSVIESNVDFLVIVGNLFSNPQPMNGTLVRVISGFNKLKKKGINTFILPGTNDTPLLMSKDDPAHFILKNLENGYLLSDLDIKKRTIDNPSCSITVDNQLIDFYCYRSPLINPSSYKMNLTINDNHLNVFVLSNAYKVFSNDFNRFKSFINNLKNFGIDRLFLGGQNAFEYDEFDDFIVYCPQIHPHDFELLNENQRVKILDISKNKTNITSSINTKPISHLDLKQKTLDINQIPGKIINESIKEIIEENSNIQTIFQLALVGKINRDSYHKIKIFDHIERGKRSNFYFELEDRIEFDSNAPDVHGLSVLEELEVLTEMRMEDTKTDSKILQSALQLIKNDWSRRED